VNPDNAARYGFRVGDLIEALETAMNGLVVSQVLDGIRQYDLVIMFDEPWRKLNVLRDVRIISPTGAVVLLSDVASISEVPGPNQISRENVRRRIVVACNVQGRDLGSTVKDIEESVALDVEFPQGYSLRFEGQFESQREATRVIVVLGLLSLLLMLGILYSHYQSLVMAAQVMMSIPFAFIGSVAALWITDQPFSVASLVGFISLCGIASRNGVLMISHYLHLMTAEGMSFGREMVIRGSLERVAPVLMTALTTGLGLIPLVMAAGQPGKELLYPVAVVVIGGLITSTILDFLVRPTVFMRFARNASGRIVKRTRAGGDSESLSDRMRVDAPDAPSAPVSPGSAGAERTKQDDAAIPSQTDTPKDASPGSSGTNATDEREPPKQTPPPEKGPEP